MSPQGPGGHDGQNPALILAGTSKNNNKHNTQ